MAIILISFIFSDDDTPLTQSCYNHSSAHLTDILNENYTYTENMTISPEKEDPFVGTYALESSENFDAFLKELGVGWMTRTVAKRTKSKYEITRNGDVYTLKTISSFKTSEISFAFGEMFEEDRLDGVKVKTKITLNGNKWIQKQFGDKEVTLVREFIGDIIKLTCVVNDVTAVRIYKRVVVPEQQTD